MKFPKAKHCIYHTTFLRNIELQISYPRNKDFEGWMANAMSKLAVDETKSKLTQSEESLIVLNPNYLLAFKEDRCLCRFNPNHFKSFNEAIALLNENKEILAELFNNKVKESRLKKVNVISAERKNNDAEDADILSNIFSENLIGRKEANTEFERSLVARMTQATLLQDDYELNINYGFSGNRKDPDQLMGVLELVVADTKPCAYSVFVKNLEKMNALVFDMFNWCVSQELLSIMRDN